MHTHATKNLLLFSIILITLLTFGCNTENEGVFMRISESVVKVDVGYVDLIGLIGDKLYSYTGKSGLQSYDPATKIWSRIESSQVMHYTTDGTNIVYASHAVGDTLNDIKTYAPGNPGTTTEWATGYHVVAMNPQHNLMLIRDAEGDFNVYPSDNSTPATPERGTATTNYAADPFSDTLRPRIIASAADEFIVSGRSNDGTKYLHFYGGTPLDNTDTAFDDNPLVAMGVSGTDNMVVIDSTGKVWSGTTAGTDFIATTSIPSFPARVPADAPYPTFVHGGNLYIQNSNNDFYSVNLASGVVSADKLGAPFTEFSYIPINSYLVDLLDTDIIYVGTKENGIWRIDMGSSEVAQL